MRILVDASAFDRFTIAINGIDTFGQLIRFKIMSQILHDRAKNRRRNFTFTFFVVHIERIASFGDLLIGQLKFGFFFSLEDSYASLTSAFGGKASSTHHGCMDSVALREKNVLLDKYLFLYYLYKRSEKEGNPNGKDRQGEKDGKESNVVCFLQIISRGYSLCTSIVVE